MMQANSDLTQREIAKQFGIITSGLNYCFKALIYKGLINMHHFSQSKNKFCYICVLPPPQVLPEKARFTNRFLQRKLAESQDLQAEIDSLLAKASAGVKDSLYFANDLEATPK